ncbi:MAG: tetratricopeptide repeat protein [Acidobacteriota bacterium]
MTTRRASPAGTIILCQACGTPNPVRLEQCRRCGLRLLVISAAQPDGDPSEEAQIFEAQEDLEENILERLTKLEDGLRSLSEALAASAGHLGQLEHNLTVTHAGVQTLTALLEQQGVVSKSEMLEDWERAADEELHSRALARRFSDRTRRILSQAVHSGNDNPEFRRRLDALETTLVRADLGAGLDQMTDLADLTPGNDELWSLLGETAFEMGELEKAASAFEKVLALRGPHLESLIYLGTVASDLGHWERAEQVLTTARDLDPTAFLPSFTLGALAGMQGRPEDAIKHLETAIALDRVPQAYYLLGANSLEMGRTGGAIDAFKEAVALAPDFEDALYQLGVAYLRRGWSKKALETFRRVLRLDPRRLRYQETVRLFSQAPPEDLPADAAQLAGRAGAALAAERQEYAFELFSRAVSAAPTHPQLRATTALLAAAIGRNRAAVRHAHRLLHQDRADSPFLAAAVAALLESLRRAGHIATARRFALQFFSESDNLPVRGIAAYEFTLIILDLDEDPTIAREMAREALDFMPRELMHFPLAALGAIAIEAERFREALRYLEQATESTRAPDVMRLLGIARLGAGDRDGARKALEISSDNGPSNLHTDLIGRLQSLSGLLEELKG